MTIKLFGITREIVGENQILLPDTQQITTVADLKVWLFDRYPPLKNLKSLAIAVDHTYAEDQEELKAGKEVALIPPVSGG